MEFSDAIKTRALATPKLEIQFLHRGGSSCCGEGSPYEGRGGVVPCSSDVDVANEQLLILFIYLCLILSLTFTLRFSFVPLLAVSL